MPFTKVPTATVLLNGDSPLFNSPDLSQSDQYYGFDTEKLRATTSPLQYQRNPVARIATTSSSTSSIPMLTWEIISVNTVVSYRPPPWPMRIGPHLFGPSIFQLGSGQDYHINIGGLYNIYNALAAVSVAGFFGFKLKWLSKFDRSTRRSSRKPLRLGIKGKYPSLIKNPVGATPQAIEMIKLAPYSTCLCFSTPIMQMGLPAGSGMRTWANHTQMDIPEINAGGVRHSEIARRLRVTSYPADQITEMAELKEVFQRIQQQKPLMLTF